MTDLEDGIRLRIMAQIFDQGPVAIVVTDSEGRIEYVNAAFESRSGYSADEARGQTPRLLKSGYTDQAVYEELWQTVKGGRVWRGQLVNRAQDGREFVEDQVVAPVFDDKGVIRHFVAIKQDVTDLSSSRDELQRQARMLRMLSDCNQSLVRSRSREQLLEEVRDILLDEGDYAYIWVGLCDTPQARTLPVAVSGGKQSGFVEQISDEERGAGIGGEAIRRGEAIVRQRIPHDSRERCCEEALARGYHSTVALPLAAPEQNIWGVLRLYSHAENGFDDAELGLLKELTEDLCFGLASHSIRESLSESEARFRTLAEDSVAGIYMIQEGRFVYVNPCLARTFGYDPEAMLGMAVTQVVAEADRQRVVDNLRRRVEGEIDSLHYELRGLRADGEEIRVEVYGARSSYLGKSAVVGTLMDVTDRYATQARMRVLSRAVDAASSGIAISDMRAEDKPFIYVNQAFERITGYRAKEVLGRNGRFLLGEDVHQPELEKLRAALRNHQSAEMVLRNYHRNGSLFWNQFSVAPVQDDEGETTHYVSVIDDISAQKNYEHQLEQLSNYDSLTGLANKNLLRDRIQQALIQSRGSGRPMALLVLDLDRFRMVHQSLGLVGSDSVLQTIGQRLQALAGPIDTVARLDADEFAWLLRDAPNESRVAHRARELMERISQPIAAGPESLSLTTSLGIGLFPRDGQDADSLMANAEAALFKAMQQRNTFRFYTPSMNDQAREHLALEMELKRACDQGELALFYQPKVDFATGRITGAEALMRWHHPVRGLVSPGLFIPLAEEAGLIGTMGRWALDEACHRMAELNRTLGSDLSVAVNLSARQFGDQSLIEHVEGVLEASGLPPSKLECELTESMLMEDPEKAEILLRQLKSHQVRVALDDFGTGFSSLSYLKRFPIDTLKIDRSFVRDIPDDEHDTAIARAIIALAQSLGLRVVAEGVETEAQRSYLKKEGCQTMQGFLFSKPLPMDDFRALVAANLKQKQNPGA